jgi:hypothetical protein
MIKMIAMKEDIPKQPMKSKLNEFNEGTKK